MSNTTRRQFLAGAGASMVVTAALGATVAVADKAGTDAGAAPAWLGEAPAITDADCT